MTAIISDVDRVTQNVRTGHVSPREVKMVKQVPGTEFEDDESTSMVPLRYPPAELKQLRRKITALLKEGKDRHEIAAVLYDEGYRTPAGIKITALQVSSQISGMGITAIKMKNMRDKASKVAKPVQPELPMVTAKQPKVEEVKKVAQTSGSISIEELRDAVLRCRDLTDSQVGKLFRLLSGASW